MILQAGARVIVDTGGPAVHLGEVVEIRPDSRVQVRLDGGAEEILDLASVKDPVQVMRQFESTLSDPLSSGEVVAIVAATSQEVA